MGFTVSKAEYLDEALCNTVAVVESLIGFFCDFDFRLSHEIGVSEDDLTIRLRIPDSENNLWLLFKMTGGTITVLVGESYHEAGSPIVVRGKISEFLCTLPEPK